MTSPHYARLPPEINSALIFAGPGAAPLLAAAKAWDGLAEDLASSASSFFSVTSDLANGAWQGASAAAMMAVATQYVNWLSAAAAQAEAASTQAAAIADAFETALEATVQPGVVAANRALVQALASGNHLGQNAPAIADIEAAYEQMWAADVVAMSGYHADASAAVAKLEPWHQVLPKLDLGPGRPASALPAGTQAIGNSVGQSVAAAPADAGSVGPLNSGHYVTGGVSSNVGSALLNSATSSTGFNSGVTGPGLLNRP
ncbi:PPE family protein [Mycobacterium sp. 663a-19]|uniref:PPE family protein n=1 Tax=Mycobacterium sp. 663a-19 TaxID=2986148 RepID=UPI003B640CCC